VAATAHAKPPRVRSIDWHRTLVVFVMIECHALMFLRPELDQSPLRHFLNAINGLVAPSFLFLAGVSFGYGVGRAEDAAARRARLKASLRRIGEVLLVANFLRLTSSPALMEPAWKWWLQVDVLSCIGYSLLLAQGLYRVAGASPALAGLTAWILGGACFVAAPFAEAVQGAGIFDYLLSSRTGSMFPLTPWAGHVLLGAAVGSALAVGGLRAFRIALGATTLVYGCVAFVGDGLARAYGEPYGWIPGNAAERVWKCGAIALALSCIEELPGISARADASRVLRVLTLFGRASLSAYAFHLLFIYGAFGLPGLHGHHGQVDWRGYAALTTLVLATTWAFCALLERRAARRRAPRRLRA
jgi:uncharacterized membrane protein